MHDRPSGCVDTRRPLSNSGQTARDRGPECPANCRGNGTHLLRSSWSRKGYRAHATSKVVPIPIPVLHMPYPARGWSRGSHAPAAIRPERLSAIDRQGANRGRVHSPARTGRGTNRRPTCDRESAAPGSSGGSSLDRRRQRSTRRRPVRLPAARVLSPRLTPSREHICSWLCDLPDPVAVAYEAGSTGLGLARSLAAADLDRQRASRAPPQPLGPTCHRGGYVPAGLLEPGAAS
jgi:hypothetical protein